MLSIISELIIFISNYVLGIFTFILLLRFLFQCLRVNFYNPFSQLLVKITNPLLIPLRRVIPGSFGIDLASIVLLFILSIIKLSILSYLYINIFPPLQLLLIWNLGELCKLTINIFYWAMIIHIIASWLVSFGIISAHQPNPIINLLNEFLKPLLNKAQKILPAANGFDFSPIVIFLGLSIISIILKHLPSPPWGVF